jgi:hypothetical protein
MRTRIGLLLALGIGVLACHAWADGCLMPTIRIWNQQREKALINEPDQKALIYFHNGEEQLVISPGFEGAVGDFAWVVPVPSRPRVEVLEGAPFHELARLIAPAPPLNMAARAAPAAAKEMASEVRVLERRVVGDYDVSVLESTASDALLKWLRANEYHLPDRAAAPMQRYIKEGWTFVACRIRSAGAGAALRSGTLTPLRLIFPATKPVYPMRLSCANPQSFAVLTYILVPRQTATKGNPSVVATQAPEGWGGRSLAVAATLDTAYARLAFPTLAKLSRTDLAIYVLQARFRPEDCTNDFVWSVPGVVARR